MSAYWSDGTPRSQGNAFDTHGYIPTKRETGLDMERSEQARRRSAKQVKELREKGKDLSVVALRPRSAAQHGGAYSRAKASGK